MARPKSNPVILSQEERDIVNSLIKSKETSDWQTKRCSILLNLDASEGRKPLTYIQIAQALQVSQPTVCNVASDYASGGLENVLTYKLKPASADSRRVVGGREEAEICRIACSPVPDGRVRWTLELIANKVHETLGIEISDETVRRVLKKGGVSLTG